MTDKPISTISYNTEPFLINRLRELTESHIIQSWAYIFHKGEDGDKDHFHLRLEPNKRVDKMTIREYFNEPDPNCELPLGCRPFRFSKEEEWVLYVVHDPIYMKIKYNDEDGKEKLPYSYTDIKCYIPADLETMWIRAKQALKHSSASIVNQLKDGVSTFSLMQQGENPHLLNAINKCLQENDYSRLAKEYQRLEMKYHKLAGAIEKKGLTLIVDKEGDFDIV